MLSILFILVCTCLGLLSFWYANVAGMITLVIWACLELIIIIPNFFKARAKEEVGLNKEEQMIFAKYHLFLRYPFGAREMSRLLSVIQAFSIIFALIFWYKSIIGYAVFFLLNYFIVGPFAIKLNPILYLGEELKRGRTMFMNEFT